MKIKIQGSLGYPELNTEVTYWASSIDRSDRDKSGTIHHVVKDNDSGGFYRYSINWYDVRGIIRHDHGEEIEGVEVQRKFLIGTEGEYFE